MQQKTSFALNWRYNIIEKDVILSMPIIQLITKDSYRSFVQKQQWNNDKPLKWKNWMNEFWSSYNYVSEFQIDRGLKKYLCSIFFYLYYVI